MISALQLIGFEKSTASPWFLGKTLWFLPDISRHDSTKMNRFIIQSGSLR